jgi:hypothetical protein
MNGAKDHIVVESRLFEAFQSIIDDLRDRMALQFVGGFFSGKKQMVVGNYIIQVSLVIQRWIVVRLLHQQ